MLGSHKGYFTKISLSGEPLQLSKYVSSCRTNETACADLHERVPLPKKWWHLWLSPNEILVDCHISECVIFLFQRKWLVSQLRYACCLCRSRWQSHVWLSTTIVVSRKWKNMEPPLQQTTMGMMRSELKTGYTETQELSLAADNDNLHCHRWRQMASWTTLGLMYRKVSNISRTKSQNLNAYRLTL